MLHYKLLHFLVKVKAIGVFIDLQYFGMNNFWPLHSELKRHKSQFGSMGNDSNFALRKTRLRVSLSFSILEAWGIG